MMSSAGDLGDPLEARTLVSEPSSGRMPVPWARVPSHITLLA